jgi:hypothetical protein
MTTTDRTTEPADVFDAHLARWEAAEADPDGTLERVARAMCEADRHDWEHTSKGFAEYWRRLAATAIEALRPAPDAPRVDDEQDNVWTRIWVMETEDDLDEIDMANLADDETEPES